MTATPNRAAAQELAQERSITAEQHLADVRAQMFQAQQELDRLAPDDLADAERIRDLRDRSSLALPAAVEEAELTAAQAAYDLAEANRAAAQANLAAAEAHADAVQAESTTIIQQAQDRMAGARMQHMQVIHDAHPSRLSEPRERLTAAKQAAERGSRDRIRRLLAH